jgi:hypothetical protein
LTTEPFAVGKFRNKEAMKRYHIFILAIAVLCSSIAQGTIVDVPESGTFDIDGPSAVSFTPIPWTSPLSSLHTFLYPFATNDLYSSGPFSKYNLAEVDFSNGSFTVNDSGERSGDLGVRITHNTGAAQTFEACILTLDFVGSGSFDIFLPQFTVGTGENMFFWVSQSGATYYANSSKGVGFPDMSAVTAMSAGEEYLAATPEPATILLLATGALLLNRRRSKKN